MKIGLVGYGTMGKLIEKVCVQRGHTITNIIDEDRHTFSDNVDCFIDFSLAAFFHENTKEICRMKIPMVIGTTGWYDDMKAVEQLFTDTENKGIWGSNFSLGVNIFMSIVEQSSHIFNDYMEHYDVLTHELHHKNKVDSPSGTALKIASLIEEKIDPKRHIQTQALDRKIKPEEMHVTSSRGGAFPGTHSVLFDSVFDTIELTHRARTREGFALGAVIAAENIEKTPVGLTDFYSFFNSMYK